MVKILEEQYVSAHDIYLWVIEVLEDARGKIWYQRLGGEFRQLLDQCTKVPPLKLTERLNRRVGRKE